VDTPVQAHSIQAACAVSERRGCSFDTGVHTLSTVVDRAKMPPGSPFHSHDNSRVGLGATIPQGRLSSGSDKLGCDPCPATMRPGGCRSSNPTLSLRPNLCRAGLDLERVGLARESADQPATSNEGKALMLLGDDGDYNNVSRAIILSRQSLRGTSELPNSRQHSLQLLLPMSHPVPVD
jgi:hypothetical protein